MQTTNPARYATRLNCDDRCIEVYDTQAAIGADGVMATFYFEDGNAGNDARALADELNYAEAKRAGEAAEKIRQSDFWSEREQADNDLITAAGGEAANPYKCRRWFDEVQIIERATGRIVAEWHYAAPEAAGMSGRTYWLRELRQRLCEREGLSEYAGPWPCEISGGMVVRRVNWGS